MRHLLIPVFLLFISANAAAVTIDFEGVVDDYGYTGLNIFPDSTYQEDGFSLYMASSEGGIGGQYFNAGGGDGNYGSAYMEWCSIDSFCPQQTGVTLTSSTGNLFSLASLDIIPEFTALNGGLEIFAVTGYYSGGGSITQTIEASELGWITMSFDGSWSSLESVVFDGVGEWAPAIDNIVVSQVPVPAAVWLFGSGLAGLGWMRRKQTA